MQAVLELHLYNYIDINEIFILNAEVVQVPKL